MINKNNLFWQVYLNLENELINLSKYIYFTDVKIKNNNTHQLDTFSPHIADLLVRCCVEIEAISKELYFDNGGTKCKGDKNIYFDTDCIDLLNKKYKTNDVVVFVTSPNFNFTLEDNYKLKPLHKAHERSKILWAKSYQAVKHDRYNSIHLGNIRTLLQSMAALYLLNFYYKDIKINCKLKDLFDIDMSFGSNIFSLEKPDLNGLINLKIIRYATSPYVLKFTDNSYKTIKATQKEELNKLTSNLFRQKEFNDYEISQDLIKLEKMYNNYDEFVKILSKLHLYKLNKKISKKLPFNERKKMFLLTPERNNKLIPKDSFLGENELTEDNIQKEIEETAKLNAIHDLFYIISKPQNLINNGDCEILIDNGNLT